jgi:hypothetical protein
MKIISWSKSIWYSLKILFPEKTNEYYVFNIF